MIDTPTNPIHEMFDTSDRWLIVDPSGSKGIVKRVGKRSVPAWVFSRFRTLNLAEDLLAEVYESTLIQAVPFFDLLMVEDSETPLLQVIGGYTAPNGFWIRGSTVHVPAHIIHKDARWHIPHRRGDAPYLKQLKYH